MTTIDQAFIDAVLADIVYVNGLSAGMGQAGNDTQTNNFRNLIARRITDPLAQEIAARFEVLAVKSDPASEYQGAVFRDKTNGQLYVANRGTAGGTDTERAGSRVKIELNGEQWHCHRPHPGKEARRYQVEEARELLERAGVVP